MCLPNTNCNSDVFCFHIAQIIWPSFLAWNGQHFGFSICQRGGKCFDPWECVEKACLQGARAVWTLLGRAQIYQLHPEKHQQNANRNISGAQIQNIEAGKYVESEGREEQHLGRMRRSKQSGQSKKRNNKKLFGKHAFISSNLQQERSGEQERGNQNRTRARMFSWDLQLFCRFLFFFLGPNSLFRSGLELGQGCSVAVYQFFVGVSEQAQRRRRTKRI